MEQRLSSVEREYERFVHAVSHDFRAPIRHIDIFSKQILSRKVEHLDDDTKQDLSVVIQAADLCNHMLDALIQYSRISAYGEPFVIFSVQECFDSAISYYQYDIQKLGAKITSVNLPAILCDQKQIVEIFKQLISNSLLFVASDQTPLITINVESKHPFWQFSFKDEGIGIPPSQLKLVFDVFKRAVLKKDYPGLGIGLSLAHQIVRRHGGEIWATSGLEHGTEIVFTLPQYE